MMKPMEVSDKSACQRLAGQLDIYGISFTGTAGDSPASSDKFTRVTVEPDAPGDVAFTESGRDARGPSEDVGSNSGRSFQTDPLPPAAAMLIIISSASPWSTFRDRKDYHPVFCRGATTS
jgi:hypothetical protein